MECRIKGGRLQQVHLIEYKPFLQRIVVKNAHKKRDANFCDDVVYLQGMRKHVYEQRGEHQVTHPYENIALHL